MSDMVGTVLERCITVARRSHGRRGDGSGQRDLDNYGDPFCQSHAAAPGASPSWQLVTARAVVFAARY